MPDMHIGRSWSGHEIEDKCPCPQEPCGLVSLDRAVPECPEHPIMAGQSIRQGHPADRCPAAQSVLVCQAHCCPTHGCKYGRDNCVVYVHQWETTFADNNGCEQCEWEAAAGE